MRRVARTPSPFNVAAVPTHTFHQFFICSEQSVRRKKIIERTLLRAQTQNIRFVTLTIYSLFFFWVVLVSSRPFFPIVNELNHHSSVSTSHYIAQQLQQVERTSEQRKKQHKRIIRSLHQFFESASVVRLVYLFRLIYLIHFQLFFRDFFFSRATKNSNDERSKICVFYFRIT